MTEERCEQCGGNLIYDRQEECLKCMMCGRPFMGKVSREEVSETKVLPQESQTEGLTYFDQHRDEILADRVKLGHGITLTKWKISYNIWMDLKSRWLKDGIEVPDLRLSTRKESMARAEAAEQLTEKVLTDELAKGNIPPTPTVREEKDKCPAEKKKEYLKAEDKIEITVGRLEEILRELEWLKGYRQAILDIQKRQ